MQVAAFVDLLEKNQDYDTNPGNEKSEHIQIRYNQPQTAYYFIVSNETEIGVIRVVDFHDESRRKRIAPIFIMPEYRNRGYAQQAIAEVEKLHGSDMWMLDTILQEEGNCSLYMGYVKTGKTEQTNDKMNIVFYEKN